MKKILSLVLVLSMVLGSFGFAFAAEEVVPDSVKRVHAAGLFGVGGLELDRIATRAELATLVLRLHGYEDAEIEALKTASNFSDVAATSWYAPYVGLAVQEGLFTGDTGANTFRPLENAKYAELLVVILRALGYGEDLAGLAWPNGYVLKAAEVGIDVDLTKDANSTVSRLVVGATIDKALDLEVKGGEETLGQKLGLEGFEPVEPEPEELEIVGVSADNLKQVVVEFNQDVTDNEDVENVDNYVLETTKGKTHSKIKDVEIDGENAILTLEKAASNQTDYVVVINKKIVGKEIEEEIKFDDFTVPVAEDAEVIGQSTIQVIFSEPIQEPSTSAFEVKSQDGKTTYRIKSVELTKNGTEALVELRSNLKDGDLITLTAKNSIKDYANFKLATTEFDLEVIEDDSEIEVVGFRKASEEGITLILNKNVKANKTKNLHEYFYHTSGRNEADKDGVKIDGNEIELKFTDNLLPTGTAYLFIEGDTLVDYWGNKNKSTIRFTAEIASDTKEPAIDGSIKVENGRKLTVKFDKRLDKKTAEDKDNYLVTYENSGKEASKIASVKLSSNQRELTINLRTQLDPGKYVLEVEDVEDALGNAEVNVEKTFSVEGQPLQAKDVKVNVYERISGGVTEYTILVDFQRSMDTEDDRYSVLDLENYSVMFDGRKTTLGQLDDKDDYYVSVDLADDDAKIVEIVIEDSAKSSKLQLLDASRKAYFYISRVMDANGLLSADLAFEGGNIDTDLNKTFSIDKVEATDKETIKVTFTKAISSDDLYIDDIAFEAPGLSLTSKDYDDYDVDGKVLTITLEKELATDLKYSNSDGSVTGVVYMVYKNADQTRTETEYGDKLITGKNGVAVKVKDKIAPEIAVNTKDEYKISAEGVNGQKLVTVDIEFTEDMDESTFSRTSFSVEDGKVDKVVVKDNIATLTVTLDDELETVTYITVNYDGVVKDVAGNALDFEDASETIQVTVK